jgi:hypothetical protein
MLARQYPVRTIKTYIYWIKFYINYHQKNHPSRLGEHDVEAFLTFLVTKKNLAASSQAVALNSIVFLYRDIIKKPLCLNK